MAGMARPHGAHYLPLPGAPAVEVSAWLHELGLLRSEHGRTRADERHLCHSPQERLFFNGQWQEGVLPLQGVSANTMAQDRRFGQRVGEPARTEQRQCQVRPELRVVRVQFGQEVGGGFLGQLFKNVRRVVRVGFGDGRPLVSMGVEVFLNLARRRSGAAPQQLRNLTRTAWS